MGYIEFEPNAIHSNGAKLYFPPPVTIVCQFVFKISTRNTYSSNMESPFIQGDLTSGYLRVLICYCLKINMRGNIVTMQSYQPMTH